MAAAREIAIDVFFAADLLDALDGVERGGVHFAYGFPAVAPDERRHGQLHAGKNHAAITGAGAPANSFGFEDGDIYAAFRERARGGESAKTAANAGNDNR